MFQHNAPLCDIRVYKYLLTTPHIVIKRWVRLELNHPEKSSQKIPKFEPLCLAGQPSWIRIYDVFISVKEGCIEPNLGEQYV